MAELDGQSFIINVRCPHRMQHIVIIQYWHHLSPIVHINGKTQVWLALIRLMVIHWAEQSVFVSIAPSDGVRLFKHWTHRVMPWSHLTFIRGCHFIIAHVTHTLCVHNLLLISTLIKRLVDWGSFVLDFDITYSVCIYGYGGHMLTKMNKFYIYKSLVLFWICISFDKRIQ